MRIQVDPLFLSKSFPEFRRYLVWKGFAIFIFLLGIVLLFIKWQVGMGIIIFGVICQLIGTYVRNKDGKAFTLRLLQRAIDEANSGGMVEICAHYLAGTVALVTELGQAHWPQYPSCALTGENKFIPIK